MRVYPTALDALDMAVTEEGGCDMFREHRLRSAYPGLADPGRWAPDHVEMLRPGRLSVWECRWCLNAHDELIGAARCAAACWDNRSRANHEATTR
jgi:hypothetical protein